MKSCVWGYDDHHLIHDVFSEAGVNLSVQTTLVFETNRDEVVSCFFQGEELLLLLDGNV